MSSTWANQVIKLDSQESIPLLTHAEFIEDKDKNLSWQSILQQNNWQEIHSQNLNLGISDSHFWFKVVLNFSDDHQRVFQIAYPPHDYVDFYLIANGELIKHEAFGDLRPFKSEKNKRSTFRVFARCKSEPSSNITH